MENETARLERSWHRAWNNLRLQPPQRLRERLIRAYSEPHRRYHSLQHLQECIIQFGSVLDFANQPGEVEIALWFHDAVYDLTAKDNERRSAEWAMSELADSGASVEQARRVQALIMATCHAVTPIDPDQQLLVDIDLAILGADPARFAEYDIQVRAEYSWVPALVYRAKRRQILKGFLDRDTIYNTQPFKDRYERQARINLQQAIS